jgi:integrase/recombinase XerD
MYREDLEAICDTIRQDYRDKLNAGLCKEGEVIWRERAFRFGFFTGLRAGEIARLAWKHIDRERGLIYILKQKNGKQQTIPLHRKASDVLDEVPTGASDDYVFGAPGTRNQDRSTRSFRNSLSRSFLSYRRDSGIQRPITLHSLRHGFCTALAEAGKSAATIKELARHASIETSMIYVKMSNEHLKSEMEDVF